MSMRYSKLAVAVALSSVAWLPAASLAATEAEKAAAIDTGLAWLATQQHADGRWTYNGGSGDVAATGAALLSFIEKGNTPTSGTYKAEVASGLTFLLNNAQNYAIAVQPAGNPDTNGNGNGIRFGPNDSYQIYNTGVVLPALVKAGSALGLDTIITSGSAAVIGKTYGNVIRDAVDYLAYSQVDVNNQYRGGWRYTPNSSSSDNSVTQWPALGLLYARSVGIDAPSFVEDELDRWIHYNQRINYNGYSTADASYGAAGYTSPGSPSTLRTASALVQMAYDGYTPTDPDPTVSSRVQAAMDYIDKYWQNTGTAWTFGDLYSMWGIYKGLELMVGIDNMTEIANLRPGNCGNDVDNPDHGCNWWEDMNEWLVNAQNAAGAWATGGYGSTDMNTAWAINILQAVEIPGGDGDHEHVPEPATLLLLGAGLLGLGYARQAKRA